MPSCSVPDCKYPTLSQSIGVSFHRFPVNVSLRRQWLTQIQNQAIPVYSTPKKLHNKFVCSKHFDFYPSDYVRDLRHELTGSKKRNILKKDAVPSICLSVSGVSQTTAETSSSGYTLGLQTVPPYVTTQQQQQGDDLQPSTSRDDSDVFQGHVDLPAELSSPFKWSVTSTPSKWSSPFKPATSGESTEYETTTTESEGESQTADSSSSTILVTQNKLNELFRKCQTCGEVIISKRTKSFGAKIVISWECVKGHEGRWDSCDDIRSMPVVNLRLTSAIIFSGNTYQSFKNLAEIMNVPFFSKSTFNSIQNTYTLPTIQEYYDKQYMNNMALLITKSLDGEGVSLLGDGRSDSPGFSAKYTTYSTMEETSQQIIDMQLVQVSEASSSVAMEKEGFVRSMEEVLHHGVNITSMTTDRSPSVRKSMREDYGWICHQFDCWHICKGVKKKCLGSGRKKGHEILLKWTKSITNHLWYSCSKCGGDAQELKRLWRSVLHHVTGVHRWEDQDGTPHSCDHLPLSEQEQESKIWFDPTSTVYRDLTNIVMDRRLQKDLEQLTLFKHTGGLEAYHSTMLKFAPKRLHFHYAAMKGRMQLAVIDHNYNTGREQATTSTGKAVFRFTSSKMQGGEWTAKSVMQAKSHAYAVEMMEDVVARRQNTSVRYGDKSFHVTLPELPKNIAKTPRPPTEHLLAKKKKM